MPLFNQSIYRAKPKAARIPTARTPVLAMFRPALESAVAEADWLAVDEASSPPEVGLAVSEASEPEAERVEVAVEEELSEELELKLEAASSTLFLPQVVDWQAFWPVASSGWAAVHWITYCSQTRAGRVCS